jgi:SAM-dependent methyltransferase
VEAVRDVEDDEHAIREFFDQGYRTHRRYWWRGDNRYSLDPTRHTAYNAAILRIAERKPGRALDLGAGEGADAIRLAKLGWQVEAVELSPVACEKIEDAARHERVGILIRNESMTAATWADAAFDLILMNGSLHYVADKRSLLTKLLRASAPDATHAVSLFSTASPIPEEHTVIPVFPDDENGVVEDFYRNARKQLRALERDMPERSHPGFGDHRHSHIKLISGIDPTDGP